MYQHQHEFRVAQIQQDRQQAAANARDLRAARPAASPPVERPAGGLWWPHRWPALPLVGRIRTAWAAR